MSHFGWSPLTFLKMLGESFFGARCAGFELRSDPEWSRGRVNSLLGAASRSKPSLLVKSEASSGSTSYLELVFVVCKELCIVSPVR